MTRMKESGIDWIGQIPEEWKVTKLKYALSISNGKDYKDIEVEEGGFPVIGSGGVFARARNYMYDGDVVLLGRKGTIDKPLFYSGKFWTVDTMFYSTALNGNNIKFMYYSALLIPFSYYSTATALPSMTQSDLNNHVLCLPSVSEQQKIADFLDKKTAQLDKVKALLEEQIQKLKDYRASLIYETVTKGLDKNVPMKDSEIDWIGQVPQGWGVKAIKYIFDEIGSGSTPKSDNEIFYDGDINWIQSGDLYQTDTVTSVGKTISYQGFKSTSALKIYQPPFVALAMYGASVGNVAVSYIDACVNQAVVVMLGASEKVRFGKYAIEASKNNLIFSAQGGTQPNISQNLIKNWSIPQPKNEEQDQIVDFLDNETSRIDKLIQIKNQQIENINKQRQTLIYDYVTGKRRV